MRRLRPVTLAMLWYPVVCLVAAGAIGGWWWLGCGEERDVTGCRAEVGPGMMLFLGAILVTGLAVLGGVWVVTKLLSLWSRGHGREAAGFGEDDLPATDASTPQGDDSEVPADRMER